MGYEDLLSVGSLTEILDGHRPANPVLQIIGFKPMGKDQMAHGPVTDELRYRLMIGDGARSHQYCVITNQEIVDDIKNGRLEKWSLIRVTSYSISDYGDGPTESRKRLLYILNLELVKKGSEVGHKLSCDAPDDPMSARPPASGYGGAMNPPMAQQNHPQQRQPVPPQSTINNSAMNQSNHQKINYNSYDAITQPQAYNMGSGGRGPEAIKSPKSMRGPLSRVIIQIAELTPYVGKWVIKGRVIAKSPLREYTNAKGPGKLFNFTIADKSAEIKVTAFNADCERIIDYIELQKVYMVGNASVKTANKQYNQNDFEITLNNDSLVELIQDDHEINDVPKMKFNFVSLASLENMTEGTLCDVIGAITSVGEVSTIMSRTKNKELKKRNITIVDMTRHSVSVTVWGESAETFKGQENDVFVNKAARLGYYGGRSLSAGDVIFVNPADIPEVRKIRAWYDNLVERNFKSLSENQEAGSNDQWKMLTEMTNLQKTKEIVSSGQLNSLYAKCVSFVLAVGKQPVYKCCPVDGCGKKLVDTQTGEMKCDKCQQTYSSYKCRFKTDIELGDVSSSSWVTLWDDKAENLFHKKAEELETHMRSENKEDYERIINKPIFNRFVFKLRSRIDNYQNEERVKLQVTTMMPLKIEEFGRKLMAEIKALSA